jgi:hypothetical protein
LIDNVGLMRYAAALTYGLAFVAWADVSCVGEAGPGPARAPGEGERAGAEARAGAARRGRLAYNDVQQKSSHNSYERREAIFDQLVYHRLRSLEFDVHTARDGEAAPAGDWFVYHVDLPGLTPATNCARLSDCLDELAAFHAAVPGHEVATIFVDLKDDFAAGHAPEQLDQLLASALPPGAVFTPADLLAACPGAADVRAAVGPGCGWPELGALRGKFLFALTGGDTCAPGSKLSAYGGGGGAARRVAFLAPEISAGCPWARLAADRASVFLNMKSGPASDDNAAAVRDAGLVGRVYGLNDEASWGAARAAGAQVLATDKVNARLDPWASTALAPPGPFAPAGEAPPPAEPSPPVGLRVRSGDVGGATDSFFFVYDAPPEADAPQAWTAYVSAPSSHVEPLAEGCLMARGSNAPDARYFAVCRPADEGGVRAHFRHDDGGDDEAAGGGAAPAPEGAAPPESWAFLKLELAPANGGGVTATGYASRDGVAWARVADHGFEAPLGLQGLAASGHDGATSVTFYFGRVERASDGAARAYGEADFPARSAVGGASGVCAQGYLP